jgi:predicted DNA-binding transcriptional regulator AlpA
MSDQPSFPDLQLLTKKDLAAICRVAPWTIDYWRGRGKLPPPVILSDKVVCWRKADIEKWLLERQANPIATRRVRRAKAKKRL